MDLHFASAWERVADTVPDSDAIVHGARRVSWREHEHDAARFAGALEAAGVEPGAKVALYLFNCPEYLIAQFGVFKHECCPINVNYRYLDDELVYLVDNSDSEVLVFHRSLGDRVARVMGSLPGVKAFVEVDDGGDHVEGTISWDDFLAAPQPRRDRDPDDRYMLYTGGTTGMPKGVMYEHQAFVAALYGQFEPLGLPVPPPTSLDMVPAFARFIHDAARIVSVPCCPLMHGTGMWVGAMPAHLTGGTVILLEGRSFDADELLAVIERERVTRAVIVGDAFARPIARAMDEAAAAGRLPDVSSVTQVVSSGAMWSAEVKEAMTRHMTNAVLVDALGSTEGGAYGAVQSDRSGGASTARFQLAEDTLIVSEDGEIVPPGSGGTGLLASRTAARGYYKDPEKTAATFREIEGSWYVITGDWATHEADGTITLHGRGSNCINSGGEKIYPEEVEEAIKTHPAVDDCYVIGVPDERFGNRIVAVAGCSTASPGEDELRDHLRGRLSGYKIPKQIIVVEEFQRAPNGKADYGWAKDVATAHVG